MVNNIFIFDYESFKILLQLINLLINKNTISK